LCANGGSCVLTNGLPTCQCQPPYSGDFCDVTQGTQPGQITTSLAPGQSTTSLAPGQSTSSLDPGQSPSSLNPGQITTSSNPGQPNTPPPNGITCANNPCRNNRPCYPNGNSYFCFCGNQYTGYNCENPAG